MSKLVGLVLGTAISAVTTAYAHHSPAEYDRSEIIELEGSARTVLWRNPHVIVELATTDANGQEVIWSLEGAAISAQRRRGVTEGMLQAGDRVRVAGYPSMRRDAHLLLEHVLLPSGTELLVGAARDPRWSQDSVGGAAAVTGPDYAQAEKPSGIFRVWTRGPGQWPWYFGEAKDFELTAWAAATAADYDQFEDNPLQDCTPPGMPSVMGNPYPMQFFDSGDTIELRFEEFDVVRTIDMNTNRAAAEVPPSPLGYSVGHWEGNTLVVATNRLTWPYFGRMGIPQSQSMSVSERFTVVDTADRIDYTIAMTDPEVFSGTTTWDATYEWHPGEQVGVYACTPDE